MALIDKETIRAKIEQIIARRPCYDENYQSGFVDAADRVLALLDTLPEQKPNQEVPADTEVLTAKLVNLLKSYRIGEETATGLANRIADTYGTQRYLDGLCDGKKGEWKSIEDQEPEYYQHFDPDC